MPAYELSDTISWFCVTCSWLPETPVGTDVAVMHSRSRCREKSQSKHQVILSSGKFFKHAQHRAGGLVWRLACVNRKVSYQYVSSTVWFDSWVNSPKWLSLFCTDFICTHFPPSSHFPTQYRDRKGREITKSYVPGSAPEDASGKGFVFPAEFRVSKGGNYGAWK